MFNHLIVYLSAPPPKVVSQQSTYNMKTRTYLIGISCLLAGFLTNLSAQSIHQKVFKHQVQKPQTTVSPQHLCGTEASPNDINYLNSIRNNSYEEDFVRDFNQGFRNMPILYVPIKAHVVRTTAGTGGLSTAQLNAAITTMNSFYINANMQFYLCSGINYIDNDTYYNFNQTDETVLTSANNVSTNINIYFMNTVTSSGGSGLCGYAYFPGGPNHIMMANSCATNGSTLSHEVGHFYALYHTHGKSNTGTTDELVDGSNCANFGDDVCDTPADPNLSGLVTSSCVYTGTATDANGDTYVPDPNNIMSYSRKACRTLFSAGQYARINSTAVNSSFRNNYSCPSSADDAGIAQIIKPADGLSFCDNPLTPQVILANNSASALTSVNINYQINSGSVTTLAWTGNLGPGASDTVNLASFVPPINPVFLFTAYTSSPNGNTDNDYSNDTLSSTTQYLLGSNLPFAEPLNSGTLPTNLTVFDQNTDGFQWTYNATVNGFGQAAGGSVVMDNFNNDTRGTLDWLFVETLDFSSANNAQLFFDVAYTRYSASFTDTLIIAINDDCGTNYTPIYFVGGSDLATAPDQTAEFIPSATQWRTDTLDLSAYDGSSQVRIAFINQGGYGQPLYLDNINVQSAIICNLSTSATVADVSCNGGNDGNITISASGSSSYSYDIGNGPQGSNVFNNLTNGAYNISITDGLGCQSTENVTVGQPTAISSSTSNVANVNCFGASDGSFALSTSGGTPNYSYDIGNGAQSAASFNNLSAATYTVTISDANNCNATSVVVIGQPNSALSASLNNSTNVNCTGGNDGSLAISVTGGTSSYSFNIGTGNQASGSFSNLTASNYTVTVTDANGCTATQVASITQPALSLSASTSALNNLNCFGDNSGSFVVNTSGGTAGYSYNLGTGAQSNNQFSGLAANSYTITVTDNNGCTATTSATLTQPTVVTASAANLVNINCFGDNNGSLSINASGGSPSYTYSLGTVTQSNNQFSGLSANNYTFTITDNNGCTATTSATINGPSSALISSIGTIQNVSCNGASDASIIVNASGGTAGYSFDLGNGAQSSGTFSGLNATNYQITVTDNNNCTSSVSANISEPAILNLTLVDNANNSATVTATGGTSPFSFLWDANAANQSTATATGLTAGNYCVTVTDANNCTNNQCINIVISSAASLSATNDQFKVFPNPTSGEVIIQLERANSSTATIRIINVLGQSIFNQTSSSKSLQMTTNLNQQASGIYWVQVEYEGIKLVRKLILIN